jgi:hypothetical protein
LASFDRWYRWLDDNRPCLTEIGGTCYIRGWLRFCTDDTDKRCTPRPGDCAFLEAVGEFLGSANADICRKILRELHLPDDFLPSVPTQVIGSAASNEIGFPLHLASVQLFLAYSMQLTNSNLTTAANILKARNNMNPFFAYLANGATPAITNLVLSLCPSPSVPSTDRNQWPWERDQSKGEWKNSMYWDCIFISKLLTR